MDPEDLVTVYTVSHATAAEIIKNFLRGEGIRAFIDNEDQAGLEGLSSNSVKIQVPAAHAEQARRLIEEHEPHKRA